LNKKIIIEVRNDNDSPFIAKSVQNFFKDNYIHQVFTHPCTSQENGHIGSFYAILSEILSRNVFWSLEDLEQCLTLFYYKYNNKRLNSAILYMPSMFFWQCWEKNFILTKIDGKKRKVKFRLLIPYQNLSGYLSLREVSCYYTKSLDGIEDYKIDTFKEIYGTILFQRLSV